MLTIGPTVHMVRIGCVRLNPPSPCPDRPRSPFAMYPGVGVNVKVNMQRCAEQLCKVQVS